MDTQTHTCIPTHEPKQFQETRCARPKAVRTWFNNFNFFLLLLMLIADGTYISVCIYCMVQPLPLIHAYTHIIKGHTVWCVCVVCVLACACMCAYTHAYITINYCSSLFCSLQRDLSKKYYTERIR